MNMKIKKCSVPIMVIIILFSLLLGYLFWTDNNIIKKIDISGVVEITDNVEFYIDNIDIDDSNIYVYGWAFRDIPKVVNRTILLRNRVDVGEVWQLNTAMVKKSGLNEIYGGEAFENAGFIANGKIKEIMEGKEYEILIYIKDTSEEYIFNTGTIIYI